ncbi:hypothetical protein V8N76_004524 [Salmonella enterica]
MSEPTETEAELANVVMFPGYTPDDPIHDAGYVHQKPDRHCFHQRGIYVNEALRQCICQECGNILDPFAYLLDIANRRTRLAGNVKALRQEERDRRKNIEKLIQIERNAKARIRRAEKGRD